MLCEERAAQIAATNGATTTATAAEQVEGAGERAGGGRGGEGAASAAVATVSFIVDIAAKKGSKGNKKQLTWLTSLLKVETHGAIYAAGVGARLVLPSTAAADADAGEQVQRVGVPSVQHLSRCVFKAKPNGLLFT